MKNSDQDTINEKCAEIAQHLEQNEVHGWLDDNAGATLYNIALRFSPTPVIVELGSWKGRSTSWLASAARDREDNSTVYAVDTWLGTANEEIHQRILENYKPDQLYDEFMKNITKMGLSSWVKPIRTDTISALDIIPRQNEIGVLFIDADHAYEAVLKDFENWSPRVANGGFIIFDDVPTWPGPTQLISELPRWYKQVGVSPNNWIVQKSICPNI